MKRKRETQGLHFLFLSITLLFALVLLPACQFQEALNGVTAGVNASENMHGDDISVLFNDTMLDNVSSTQMTRPAAAKTGEEQTGKGENNGRFVVRKTEGDLVILAPEAIDPDGDYVTYTFSSPFDKHGRWQTKLGDEGTYHVTVTATDTKGASTTEDVTVIIQHANRPPFLTCPQRIVVKEGDTINLSCEAYDEEGTNITLTTLGWLTTSTYQTGFEDAGTHDVTVRATDGDGLTTEQHVTIVVQNVNRPPRFPDDFTQEISATEGDVITIDTSGVEDPDGDPVTFFFSEPFNQKGVWRTKIGDAGTYNVDVVASDGTSTTKKRVIVKVGMANTPPVLKRIPDVTVYEGETIKLDIKASDREGDPLTTVVSGWMTSPVYTTTYDDAGTYTVKVTVSDGQFSDSQVVHITVIDRNRPPQFVVPG